MRKMFTKAFFQLTPGDQSRVLDSILADITNQLYVSTEDEARARRIARWIERKAVEYGIWSEDSAS